MRLKGALARRLGLFFDFSCLLSPVTEHHLPLRLSSAPTSFPCFVSCSSLHVFLRGRVVGFDVLCLSSNAPAHGLMLEHNRMACTANTAPVLFHDANQHTTMARQGPWLRRRGLRDRIYREVPGGRWVTLVLVDQDVDRSPGDPESHHVLGSGPCNGQSRTLQCTGSAVILSSR